MRSDDSIGRLPQREPFLFVSRVDVLVPGERVEAAWTLRGDESFFAGHFPGDPVVPGVLIAEALAQASGLAADSGAGAGRLAHVNIRMRSSVRPPAEVRLESRVEREINGRLWLFDVRASCGEIEVAAGSLSLALEPGGAGGGRP